MIKDPHGSRESERYENPIPSREFILTQLEAHGEPASFDWIAENIGVVEPEQLVGLQRRLRAMERDGQLAMDRRGYFAIADRLELVAGKIEAHADGFGFLLPDSGGEDVFLARRQMRLVFHGDRAQVRVRGVDRRGRATGEIIDVLERSTTQIVGRLFRESNVAFVEPLNKRLTQDILIPTPDMGGALTNQVVVVQVIEPPSHHSPAKGRVVEVLGDHLTPGIEIEIALRSNDIPVDFSDEALGEADQIEIEVAEDDKQNRVDLRGLPLVTIDGADARDFDDAVLCEPKKSGGWRLFVAIADVSRYVMPGSPLDVCGQERATSVYFPQYVVPMLPEKLSNGLCSLNPDVDRLALVCEMTVSARGRVSGYEFYEAVMRSHARLTYDQVGQILAGDSKARADAAAIVPQIDALQALYSVFVDQRRKRGALDLDSNELGFEFNDAGSVTAIKPLVRNDAHRLIEECMLAANVCAARLIGQSGRAGLFRVHDRPKIEKIGQLAEFLRSYGIQIRDENVPSPGDLQAVIDQLRKLPGGRVLQVAVLRSMNQAVYQPHNLGHFGLNYKEYAHFTSPIRRYPDLLTHRLIKALIHRRGQHAHVHRAGKLSRRKFYPYEDDEVAAFGTHCSMAERRADAAVYEVLEFLKCDFISERTGEDAAGIITGVTHFGLFVELSDTFVEGLIHVSTLTGDYFRFNSGQQLLVGERTGRSFGLGDAVTVQIAGVNVDERKVDFELLTHTPLNRRQVGSRGDGKRSDKRSAKKGRRGRPQAARSEEGKGPPPGGGGTEQRGGEKNAAASGTVPRSKRTRKRSGADGKPKKRGEKTSSPAGKNPGGKDASGESASPKSASGKNAPTESVGGDNSSKSPSGTKATRRRSRGKRQ